MDCTNCGATVPEGARECPTCGAPVSPAEPSYVPAPAPLDSNEYVADTDIAAATLRLLPQIASFDPAGYRELRASPALTPVALLTVPLAIFAYALGTYLWIAIEFEADWGLFWKSVLIGTLIGSALWAAWIVLAYLALTMWFQETVRLDELLRVAGAASLILAIGFFALIPGITFGVSLFALAAWVAATIFALQTAFELNPQRAIVSTLPGFALFAVIMPLISTSENPFGPGIFVFDSLKDVLVEFVNAFALE